MICFRLPLQEGAGIWEFARQVSGSALGCQSEERLIERLQMRGKHLVKPVTKPMEDRDGGFSVDAKGMFPAVPRKTLFGRALELSAQPA